MVHARENRTPLVSPGQIEHHVADLTATIAADVTLDQVQRKIGDSVQWLAIDGDGDRTVGELVERNSTGPMRLGYGGWRDVLLGAQFTSGRGELITAGGRTLKNVAGYDLTKFMIGQFGVFGRVVTITTRTYKRPGAALLATFPPDVRKLNALLVTSCRPQWALVDRQTLRCGYLGDERTIRFYESALAAHKPAQVQRASVEEDVALRGRLWRPLRESSFFRASVPPSRIRHFADQISVDDWIADAAFGVVLGSCKPDDADALRRTAESVSGSIVIFDSSGHPVDLVTQPGVAPLLQRLKYAFDPDARLRPLPIEGTSSGEESFA